MSGGEISNNTNFSVNKKDDKSTKTCVSCGQFHHSNEPHLYNYESSVDDDLMCQICLQPFVEPVDTPCSHTFCKMCLNAYLKISPTCPLDRRQLNKKTLKLSNLVLRRLLDKLLVKCPNTDRSCSQIMARGDIYHHLSHKCVATLLACPQILSGCVFRGHQKSMDAHTKECEFILNPLRSQLTIQRKHAIVEGEICRVLIPRTSQFLGLAVVGGCDTPLKCAVIQEVYVEYLISEDGRVKAGDQLIEINGVDMTHCSHDQIVFALRQMTPILELGIYREHVHKLSSSNNVTQNNTQHVFVDVNNNINDIVSDNCQIKNNLKEATTFQPFTFTGEFLVAVKVRRKMLTTPFGLKLASVKHVTEQGETFHFVVVCGTTPESADDLLRNSEELHTSTSSLLMNNDRIIYVNGIDMRQCSIDQISMSIQKCESVTFVVARKRQTATCSRSSIVEGKSSNSNLSRPQVPEIPSIVVQNPNLSLGTTVNNTGGLHLRCKSEPLIQRLALMSNCEEEDECLNDIEYIQEPNGQAVEQSPSLCQLSLYDFEDVENGGNCCGDLLENNRSSDSLDMINHPTFDNPSPIEVDAMAVYEADGSSEQQQERGHVGEVKSTRKSNKRFRSMEHLLVETASSIVSCSESKNESDEIDAKAMNSVYTNTTAKVEEVGELLLQSLRPGDSICHTSVKKDHDSKKTVTARMIKRRRVTIAKVVGESLGMRIGGGISSNEGDTPIYVANIHPCGSVGLSKQLRKGDILLTLDDQPLSGLTHSQAVSALKGTLNKAHIVLEVWENDSMRKHCSHIATCSSNSSFAHNQAPQCYSSTSGPSNFVPSWLFWTRLPLHIQYPASVVLHRKEVGVSWGFSIVGGVVSSTKTSDCSPGDAEESTGTCVDPIHILYVVGESPAGETGRLRCGDRLVSVDGCSLCGVDHKEAVSMLKNNSSFTLVLEVVSWLGTEV